jgi:hypothetical protein
MQRKLLLSCFIICLSLAPLAFAKNIIKYNFENIFLDLKDNKILAYANWRFAWDQEDYVAQETLSLAHRNSLDLPMLLQKPIQIIKARKIEKINKQIKFFLYKAGSDDKINLNSSECLITLKVAPLPHFYTVKFFGILHAPGGNKYPFIKNFSCEVKTD